MMLGTVEITWNHPMFFSFIQVVDFCIFLSTRFRSLNSLQTSISVFIHDVIVFHAGTSDTHPQLASASHWWPVAGLRNTRPLVLTPSWQKSFSTIWVWINTYFLPFLVGWTSINPSYFDVNYRGTIGFDTLPFDLFLWWLSRPLPAWVLASEPLQFKGVIHSIAKKSGALPRECEASCFLIQLGRCIMPWFGRVFDPGRRPTVSPRNCPSWSMAVLQRASSALGSLSWWSHSPVC